MWLNLYFLVVWKIKSNLGFKVLFHRTIKFKSLRKICVHVCYPDQIVKQQQQQQKTYTEHDPF